MSEPSGKTRGFKELLAYKHPDEEKVTINPENETCLLTFVYPYEIDLDRIKTPRDLLAWTLHLCEKNWMTTVRLAIFIEKVAAHKGFKVTGL